MNACRSAALAQRQRGELQPGRPALGALLQQLDVAGLEAERERAVEQRVGLGAVELQLVGAHLDQLAGGAQAGERQRRVGARRERELERPRRVPQQERHRRVDELVLQHVVVVEHQHDRLGQLRELVDEPRQHDVDQRRAGVRQRRRAPRRRTPGATVRSAAIT